MHNENIEASSSAVSEGALPLLVEERSGDPQSPNDRSHIPYQSGLDHRANDRMGTNGT